MNEQLSFFFHNDKEPVVKDNVRAQMCKNQIYGGLVDSFLLTQQCNPMSNTIQVMYCACFKGP